MNSSIILFIKKGYLAMTQNPDAIMAQIDKFDGIKFFKTFQGKKIYKQSKNTITNWENLFAAYKSQLRANIFIHEELLPMGSREETKTR